jgi:hypothetical protein
MGRSQQVIEALKQASAPLTVREILKITGLPDVDAKHVSSIIWSYLKSKAFVECTSRPCMVTGHMAKTYRASEALQKSMLQQSVLPKAISVPIPSPITEELAVVIVIHKNGKIEIHQCNSSNIEIHGSDSKLKLSA